MDIQNEIDKLEDLIGDKPGVVTVQIVGDDAKLETIELVVEGAASGNQMGGSLNTYISSLVSYYGEIAANNTDFTNELAALNNCIDTEEKHYLQPRMNGINMKLEHGNIQQQQDQLQ